MYAFLESPEMLHAAGLSESAESGALIAIESGESPTLPVATRSSEGKLDISATRVVESASPSTVRT